MVTKNGQRMGREGTGRYVEHARQHLTGDLVHIGDHQQQALRSGVGGGQGAGIQRAVNGTGSAALRLHLNHLYRLAEQVLFAIGSPLVHVLCHGRGGSDGENARHFSKRIAYVCSSVVTVHGFELSCHRIPCFLSFIGVDFRPLYWFAPQHLGTKSERKRAASPQTGVKRW